MMNKSPPVSAARRQPKQARSRLLVASIREACRRILQEDGPELLTAKHIAEVAGVPIGSFYQYYRNKEAVLLDVLLESAPQEADRVADESRYLSTLRWESLERTLNELVCVTCQRHQRLLLQHGEVYRRYHREIGFDALLLDSVSRYIKVQSVQEWMRETLAWHRPERDAEAIEVSAFLIVGTLTEMTAHAVDNKPEWLASPRFRTELQHLLVAYARDGSKPEEE